MRLHSLFVAAAALALAAGCDSRGPQGDPRDAVPVQSLIERLDQRHQQLSELLRLRRDLQQRKGELDSEQRRIAARYPGGEPPPDRPEVRAFQAKVDAFNQEVERYNALAEELASQLQGRSPQQVAQRLEEIDRLRDNLQDALQADNFAKAGYIARHSELAREFGYRAP